MQYLVNHVEELYINKSSHGSGQKPFEYSEITPPSTSPFTLGGSKNSLSNTNLKPEIFLLCEQNENAPLQR